MYCCWLSYIHSYQYLNLKKYNKIELENNYIKSANQYLIKLLNLPVSDKKLYKVSLKKEENELKNIKILVDVNITYLEYLVYNGEKIPDRQIFFKLVRRNLDNKINPYNLINSIITKKNEIKSKTLLKKK